MEKTQLFLITDEGINKLAKKITQQLMPLRKAIDITEEETFLTIDELSKLIKMSKGSIYQLVYKNSIPYHKKGKLYFLKSEILDWIKSGKQETKSALQQKADEYLAKNPFI